MSSEPVLSDSLKWTAKILNGGLAGIIGVTCVFPIDLCKTRLQNQQPGPNGELLYKNMRECAIKTYRAEKGFRGMYSGSFVNLVLITPEKMIKLVGNDFFRHKLGESEGKLTLFRASIAGGCAGACQIIVTTPMELLKIQLQDAGRSATVDSKAVADGTASVKKLSALSITKMLYKEKGIFGVYKGMGATALRDITFSAIYFPLFANLNVWFKKKLNIEENRFYLTCLSGILAGGVASLAVNPFDVVKTRLQTIHKGHGERSYNGISDCFMKVWKHEGWKAFYKGGGCRIMVIAPLFGIAQMVYWFGVAENMLIYGGQAKDYIIGKEKHDKWN